MEPLIYNSVGVGDCLHEWISERHLGEVMDTMHCLICNATPPRFVGPHRCGSILSMPDHLRPYGSQARLASET